MEKIQIKIPTSQSKPCQRQSILEPKNNIKKIPLEKEGFFMRNILFLFCFRRTTRSCFATTHTTTIFDQLESFLKEDSEEEKVETDLFEETNGFHVETTIKGFQMSQFKENCYTDHCREVFLQPTANEIPPKTSINAARVPSASAI